MKHVAIIGCGQLARMLALAGWRMGIRFSFVACHEEETHCINGLGNIVRWRGSRTASDLYRALGNPDAITVERESVCTELLQGLSQHCAVHPNHEAVWTCQHRLREKHMLDGLEIATADYCGALTPDDMELAIAQLGCPVMVKAASDSYDGKQQRRLENRADLAAMKTLLKDQNSGEWLVEKCIPFEREVSFIAARSTGGDIVFYPPTENVHRNGILMHSTAPAQGLDGGLEQSGRNYLTALMEAMKYVGVLSMECFVLDNRLLVNELAPRVHNSGHWTLDAHITCQFENHLRAILGLPLGDTHLNHYSGLVNILGEQDQALNLASLSASAAVHWYNKPFAPGRKLGHLGLSADSSLELQRQVRQLHHELSTPGSHA
jgi:5-(carboxyamino)imidazole ribonucleotide synthase